MTKIVYNACFGGFSLSDAAIRRYAEIKGIVLYPEKTPYGFTNWWTLPPEEREGKVLSEEAFRAADMDARAASNKFCSDNQINDRSIPRAEPVLVQVVEELGDEANGAHAKLKVAEVPDGGKYRIDEYYGFESVETPDSYDWSVA